MHRREFLIRLGGTVVAVPIILEVVGCGDDTPTGSDGDGFSVTSSQDAGHTHQVKVLCADLSANSVQYVSTTDGGHSHTVSLSAADLANIAAGGSVAATLALASGHTHTATIQKPSGTC